MAAAPLPEAASPVSGLGNVPARPSRIALLRPGLPASFGDRSSEACACAELVA